MKIKVLGTLGTYSNKEHNCAGFLVENKDAKLLLDCGPGVMKELNVKEDLENLSIILTHYHLDHFSDLLPLFYASYTQHNLGLLKNKINIYLPKEECLLRSLLTDESIEKYVDFHFIEEDTILSIGSMHIMFARNPHPVYTLSVKVRDESGILVYSSDTGYEGNKLESFATNANVFLCEASYLRTYKRKSDTHLYADEAGRIARIANVESLYLFHTYPGEDIKDYIKEAKQEFKRVSALNEGDIIDLERE